MTKNLSLTAVFLLAIFFIPVASALPYCTDQPRLGQNCTFAASNDTFTGGGGVECGQYRIVNESGVVVENGTLVSLHLGVQVFNFTHVTQPKTYAVFACEQVSVVDVGGNAGGEDKMPLAAIILLPLLFSGVLLGASSLINREEHGALRMLMNVFSILMVVPSLWFALIVSVNYFNVGELHDAMGTLLLVVGFFLTLVLIYLSFYVFITFIQGVRRKKFQRMEY